MSEENLYHGRQCTAKSKRTHVRCLRPAIVGKRVCYHHGGKSPGRPVITGRYSQFFQPDDAEGKAIYEAFRDDPNLEELANEVAILRAKFAQYQKKTSTQTDGRTVDMFLSFLEGIGKLVEKRHKIKYGEQYTITTRDFETMSARLFDLVREVYGNDERYQRLIVRAREVFGAGAA